MTDPIFTRVSVREFRDLPVDDALITRLLKAAMQAPSAGDQRPWEFWVVTDPKTKEALSLASPYAEAAAKAPVVIVPCLVKPKLIYPENCQMDLSAATLSILLEAEQLDLGGTWMSLMPLEDRMDKVTEILSLPSTVVPFALVAIGYPLDDHPQEKRFDPSRVHYVKRRSFFGVQRSWRIDPVNKKGARRLLLFPGSDRLADQFRGFSAKLPAKSSNAIVNGIKNAVSRPTCSATEPRSGGIKRSVP